MPDVTRLASRRAPRRHTVAAIAQRGGHPFELAVACEVFGLDRPELGVPWYDFKVVAAQPPPLHLGTFTLDTPYGLDELATADTIVVPMSFPDEDPDARLTGALRAAYERGARLVSFCSGAFALAAAGVLDGKRATTHWMYSALLAKRYPLVDVQPDVLYVDEGQVLTSAGTSAAIDVALHVVRTDYGSDIANAVARRMVVPPHRDGGQAQFVERPVPEETSAHGMAATLDWAIEHLHEHLTVERLAGHALMSTRTFMRRFNAATGTTPLRWLLQQRVLLARQLLEESDESVERIAAHAGFGSAANLRTHFTRMVGTTPTSYRRTFQARGKDAVAHPSPAGRVGGRRRRGDRREQHVRVEDPVRVERVLDGTHRGDLGR
jgi:AraC family transcriptional activator FtrA